ncbi:hypothetical protein [Celerinatantimonas yamalensis]|uniref:Flagellar protein FliT n=1 Tax=Celerinatantimonas yamalensis TaxID=559956 RepID=A0ABW9G7Q6_9GAMM
MTKSESLLEQLEQRSDELLALIVTQLNHSDEAERLTQLLDDHQLILEQIVEVGGHDHRSVLAERLTRLQQVFDEFAKGQQLIEQQLGALRQTKRLAKTYNPQR